MIYLVKNFIKLLLFYKVPIFHVAFARNTKDITSIIRFSATYDMPMPITGTPFLRPKNDMIKIIANTIKRTMENNDFITRNSLWFMLDVKIVLFI